MTVLTRLDRWYVPTHQSFSCFLWDIQVRCDLVWAPTSSDHQPVVLTIEPVEGERGHDRHTIREDLIFEPGMQKKIIELTEAAYKGQATKVKKWCKAMCKFSLHYSCCAHVRSWVMLVVARRAALIRQV